MVKLSPSGDHVFSQRFGGPGSQIPQGITIDSAGNVLLTGSFWNTVDFGGGTLQSAGLTDMFVAKLSTAGAHLFSGHFGDAGNQYSHAVALDGAGGPLIAGPFDGTIDFGGGSLPSAGSNDVFLAALDASGQHRWSKRFGDSNIQSASGVAVDGLGNIWMTGDFLGSIDLGTGTLTSAGLYDMFLASFDPNGNPLWSQHFGDAKLQKGQSLAAAPDGTVILTGEFSGTIDLGTGPLTSQSGNSTFLAKFTQ